MPTSIKMLTVYPIVGTTARLMSYGYDSTTAFSKSVTDVEDQATMLLDTLNSERQSEAEIRRPLMFIAHSLGGVIVKKVRSLNLGRAFQMLRGILP